MIGTEEKDELEHSKFYEAYLKVVAQEYELPDDLYVWAIDKARDIKSHVPDEIPYWSAWFAARKVAGVLLNKMRGLEGEEITPEMIEEFRSLCATLAYD
tara:strand:+ start:1463 stop:1759 length:297 start_codon:yes stop_codon:yes gene_type:complete